MDFNILASVWSVGKVLCTLDSDDLLVWSKRKMFESGSMVPSENGRR